MVPAILGAAAGLGRLAAPYVANIVKQWGTKGTPGIGLVKAVTGTAPSIAAKGIVIGAGSSAAEDALGLNIPEVTPNALLGDLAYNIGKNGLGYLPGLSTTEQEAVEKEKQLSEARIAYNESLFTKSKTIKGQ